MLKKFLRSGLSASGISHVVTARSFFRRILWVIALLMISAAMMFMTYNVLQEYLKYPTVMHMMRMPMKEMEFPAVTMCSYNLIPRHHHREANLQHLNDMLNVLDELPVYNISGPEKSRCMKDPLCRWLRFTDKCRCSKTACDTNECYPHKNGTVCACSRAVCLPRDDDGPTGCWTFDDEGQNICVCRKDFQYHRYTPKTKSLNKEFLATLEHIQTSSKVKDLMKALKNSSLVGLRDINALLRPNITIRDNYGISYDNLILSCTFGSAPCDARQDMSTLYSPTYGKCYTFNYAGVENPAAKVKIVRHAGRTHGLLLYMKSPRDSIFPLFTPNYGARIVIHDPRSLPFASQNGFDIRSGDMTTVVVQYEEVNRLGPPWTECAWDGDNKTSSYLPKPYSMLGCLRQCVNNHIFKRCKCHFDRFFSGTIIPHRTHVCSADKAACVLTVVEERNQNKIKCQCPPPCREKKYDVSISAGKVNREFFRVMKKVRTLKMINGTPAVAEPEFNLGLMGLHVYVGSFAAINTSETSIYSWESLVSNVGGNLGLFLGLSLITFVEIAEFIVEITAQAFCQKRRSFK